MSDDGHTTETPTSNQSKFTLEMTSTVSEDQKITTEPSWTMTNESPRTSVPNNSTMNPVTGGVVDIFIPEGCMVQLQQDFLPHDNPDNIISQKVKTA